jgi:hypothetical protein
MRGGQSQLFVGVCLCYVCLYCAGACRGHVTITALSVTTGTMPALCNGSSTTLPPAQCAFWVSLYDNNGGSTHWKNCREWRTDPCACQYIGPEGGNRGITCSLDVHIAVMYVECALRSTGVRLTPCGLAGI